MRYLFFALTLLLTAGAAGAARGQAVPGTWAFYPDDPVWTDPDRLDAPVPAPDDTPPYYDLLLHSFGDPSDYQGPALNANTLQEVPNSSWYTNRHYHARMPIAALVEGPEAGRGPSLEGPWKVVAGKQEGAALGMQVVDARGDRYLLKFDPPDHPEMSTAAEVITTRLFHALGYHVPENNVATFTRDRLVTGDAATYETGDGEERPLTPAVIDSMLAGAYRYPDGHYRAMASRFVDGAPVGPFAYYGTRPDDANDVYPHEARRELRGMRVFAAWVNHYDARSANSLDVAVEDGGRTFVRHYLIDFGSTLGSGPSGRTPRWLGHEYTFEWWPVLVRTTTLGFGASGWVDIDYPDHPALGRWEAEHFAPAGWKPSYPNPAFDRMDAADAFWAARQVMHFTDEELRAVVASGQYGDPDVARRVAHVLIARRDAIGAAYLGFGGGLDRFRVEAGSLRFDDLLSRHQLVDETPVRTVRWRPFDNAAQQAGAVFAAAAVTGEATTLPDADVPYLVAEIATPGRGVTRAYLRHTPRGYEVVGLDRAGGDT